MSKPKFSIDYQLFKETSHSPALIDIVGEDKIDLFIDYCFIANPYYPTSEMIEELKEKFYSMIKAYPSSNPKLARQNLADVLQVNPDYLVLGNGATELITIIEKLLIKEIAIPIPTFSEYIEKLRNKEAAKLYQLNSQQNYQLDLNQYAQWINEDRLSSALIINPGNPSGQLLSVNELRSFMMKMKHLELILLDESFIDFADETIPSLLPFVSEYPNLIIIRSMSKHCGVPGLRLGYCCTSNLSFVKGISEYIPVWNINSIAEYFLTQLKRTNYIYHKTRMQVIGDVQDLFHQLKEIDGFEVYPTGSNFILIKITCDFTAYELQVRLLEEFGLYVRDCSNKIGLDNYHIRVSSQGKDNDRKLIDALKTLSVNCMDKN